MAESIFYNKSKLCNTDISDFTDLQGIGNDPLYVRYDSIFSIIRHYIDPQYHGFLAQPDYKEGIINWYVDEWDDQPTALDSLDGEERARYEAIKEKTVSHYRHVCSTLPTDEMMILASALKYVDDRFIYCYDGKVSMVAWGMRPDTQKMPIDGRWVKGLEYAAKHKITFDTGANGSLAVPERRNATRQFGFRLSKKDLPEVIPAEGFKFKGWTPDPVGREVKEDMTFTAVYEELPKPILPDEMDDLPRMARCVFLPGEHGTIEGSNVLEKPEGTVITGQEIPFVTPEKGYVFKGWNIDPVNMTAMGEMKFIAQYEKHLPWWKRWWGAIPVWLRWLLLALLLLILFGIFFHGCRDFGCSRCSRVKDTDIAVLDSINGRDNNGFVHGITDKDGHLPSEPVVPPVVDENGNMPPIIHNEGAPDVIANRLNIYFEEENANLDQWAQDFKAAYPGDEYQIIGYDPNVRMIQIMIPENQRDRMREELPTKLSRQKFFVIDESIMSLLGDFKASEDSASKGWHLKAVNARGGWEQTRGSEDVVLAVVDDGIDFSHPIFDGNRFHKAYNVFTRDNKLSAGQGHGTHVAGLAAGNARYVEQGAAGIAQNVKLMPIQIFDNGVSTLSSIASGIMYAIHNGADVVNISVGPSFAGLDALPYEEQRIIASEYFKNEEAVFRHIIDTANKKNVILVFAAGNDNILTAILPECRSAKTINVGAVDQDIRATAFTNYMQGTHITAPGKDVYSAFPGGTFKSADGTSMAAPIVAGAVALMRSIKPDLNVAQAIGVLQKTGLPTNDYLPIIPPMVQLDKALQAVKNGDIPDGPVFEFPDLDDNGYVVVDGEPVQVVKADEVYVTYPDSVVVVGYDPVAPVVVDHGTVVDRRNGVGVGDGDRRVVDDRNGNSRNRGNHDDYSSLKERLKQLKQQRDRLNQQINDLENQIK